MQIQRSIAAPDFAQRADRRRVWLAWALCGLALLLFVVGAGLYFGIERQDLRDLLGLVYAFACVGTGMFIITRRPPNVVGWLLLLAGVSVIGGFAALNYGLYGAVMHPGALPWPLHVAWSSTVLLPVATVMVVGWLPLVFPDGRLLSDRWRAVAGLVLLVTLLGIVVNTVQSGGIQGDPRLPNPFAPGLPAPWSAMLTTIRDVSVLLVFALCAGSVVVRYRRATGDERLQMKWLTYATLLWGCMALVSTLAEQVSPALFPLADTLVFATFVFIPISIGIGVLRYRLYDIDVLINRTLVYGLLTAGTVGAYVVLVTGLGALFAVPGSPFVALLATGVIAVLFQPLRVRVQRAINRLIYGERDEPYTALTRLGARLEGTLAPDAVLPTLVQTVAETLNLPYVAIALPVSERRSNGEFAWTIAAAYGEPPPDASGPSGYRITLNYHGEPVGQLRLTPRRGVAFSPADERLLRELARQAGAAVHAVQLTATLQARMDELRRSRERLVTAQEEERRRIQRDLHDGLGPVLASMRFRLEACLDQAQTCAPELAADLERLDALVGQASTDIRRLVHDLRPPALDQVGLVAAVQQHIARVRRETGLRVQFQADVPAALSAATEVTIYRTVQEALLNVQKHARATFVTIRLEPLGDALLAHIQDDGVGGAHEGRTSSGGNGLAGMRERAELLGGTLVVHSPPQGGTTLEMYLPIGEGAL